MSNHKANSNRRKAGGEISAMEAGISEISSSKVLEQKNNTARSGMVLRSHSQGLQLSPLKRILVGASAKEGVRSRQGRSQRGLMASSTAVIQVHSGAFEA